MSNKILLFLIAVKILLLLTACAPISTEIAPESPVVNLSKSFTEVLKLDFNEAHLVSHQPSTMIIKGVFGSGEELIALLDYQLQRFIVANKIDNSIKYTFDVPQKGGCGNTQVLEVVSMDSILYLDDERQEILIYNEDGFKQAYSLGILKKNHHELMMIQPFSEFLRSIDGYIGFSTSISYGSGGPDMDYDSLMDDRNMVSFFKAHADSLIEKEIPIKPFIKRTTFPDLMYVDKPFFEVNTTTGEILVFHVSSDTVLTYNWDSEIVEKHLITGSAVKLVPAKLPRKGTAFEALEMYEKQERGQHSIYFDNNSGKYIRYLEKKFPVGSVDGIPSRTDIRLLQLLNEDFEVEAEMDYPEEYGRPAKVNGAVYLRKFDDEKKELIIYKFELQVANKEVTDTAF